MASHGQTLTDVLERIWSRPVKTKGDYAREQANLIAMAASDGFITTRIAAGLYGREWRITPAGLTHLYRLRSIPNGSTAGRP